MSGQAPTLGGIPVFVSPYAIERIEDWSGCRSPSRAKRRLARGFRQHLIVKEVPAAFLVQGRLLVHPDQWQVIKLRTDLARN